MTHEGDRSKSDVGHQQDEIKTAVDVFNIFKVL
jgi:hypothetical protein